MVDLVLEDLGGPAGEGLDAGLEFFVLPLDLDGLEALGLSGAGEGETALLGLIRPGLFEDDRQRRSCSPPCRHSRLCGR